MKNIDRLHERINTYELPHIWKGFPELQKDSAAREQEKHVTKYTWTSKYSRKRKRSGKCSHKMDWLQEGQRLPQIDVIDRHFMSRKVLESYQRTEKAVEYEYDDDTNYKWHAQNSSDDLRKETGGIGNQGRNRDHADNIVVEIGKNCEESRTAKVANCHSDSSESPPADIGRKLPIIITRRTNFFGILKYKRVTKSRPDYQTKC